MQSYELIELIAKGESSTLEFKRKIASPEKLAKEITAFANTLGGIIIIGVDDDGSIVGVESEKGDIDFIKKVCDFYVDPPINPNIQIVTIRHKELVLIIVPKSKSKPVKIVLEPDNTKSEKIAYIRVGEKSLIASREMARILASQNDDSKPLTLSIGDKEKRLFIYLEKNERATAKDFASIANISLRRAERLLVRLVRAGIIQIHVDSNSDFFTLVK
jgi:predicted HTH transcriptional regulator